MHWTLTFEQEYMSRRLETVHNFQGQNVTQGHKDVREEILGREAFAVDKTVVIVSTVVIPSDTRAGDASRCVVTK